MYFSCDECKRATLVSTSLIDDKHAFCSDACLKSFRFRIEHSAACLPNCRYCGSKTYPASAFVNMTTSKVYCSVACLNAANELNMDRG